MRNVEGRSEDATLLICDSISFAVLHGVHYLNQGFSEFRLNTLSPYIWGIYNDSISRRIAVQILDYDADTIKQNSCYTNEMLGSQR